jgi:hypothetical protein
MSTNTSATLQVHVFTLDNALSYLKENLQTDADFSGDNGPDYLDDDADGYDSNLEYYLEMFWSNHKPKDKASLNTFFDKFFRFMQERDQYYLQIEFDLKFIGDQIVLSVMMACEC